MGLLEPRCHLAVDPWGCCGRNLHLSLVDRGSAVIVRVLEPHDLGTEEGKRKKSSQVSVKANLYKVLLFYSEYTFTYFGVTRAYLVVALQVGDHIASHPCFSVHSPCLAWQLGSSGLDWPWLATTCCCPWWGHGGLRGGRPRPHSSWRHDGHTAWSAICRTSHCSWPNRRVNLTWIITLIGDNTCYFFWIWNRKPLSVKKKYISAAVLDTIRCAWHPFKGT